MIFLLICVARGKKSSAIYLEVGRLSKTKQLTPPKTNIEPENTSLEKEKHLR